MSRIVHGESPEVQNYQVGAGGTRALPSGRRFHTGKVEGTFSRLDLDQAAERARQEGRVQGAQEAERRVSQPLQAALQNLEGVLDEVSRFRRELFKEAELEALELIKKISKKVVLKELQLQPELLKSIVEKSLEVVEREKQITIHFNPADLKTFQSAKPDFMQKFAGSTELRMMSDSSIAAGSALIRTESVQVDLNVETMVDHLLEQIQQSKIDDKEVNDDGDKA